MGPVAQFLFLSLSVALSYATPAHNYPFYLGTGNSQQYSSQDSTGNYKFGYDEGHSSGGTFRKESGDAFGNKFGSYGLRHADGSQRIVDYVADAAGFRADIKTNEPGVSPDDPASTTINKVLVPVVKQEPVTVFTKPVGKSVPAPVTYAIEQGSALCHPAICSNSAPLQIPQLSLPGLYQVPSQEQVSVFTKTVPNPPVVKQEPAAVFTPVVKQEPVTVFTKPVGKSVPAPVTYGYAIEQGSALCNPAYGCCKLR